MRQVYIDDEGRVRQWRVEPPPACDRGPDGLIDGRLPVYKIREGESTRSFAERLVDGLYADRD